MKILVLSFYYPPDLSAGSFRTAAFVKALRDVLGEAAEIEVLTTAPNRYATYQALAALTERNGNLTVQRFALPRHRSGLFDQSKAFIAFAIQVTRHVRAQKYDLVFATTSRLMTGYLGARIAKKFNVPLFLDIRDIFLDTITDIYPRAAANLVGPMVEWIESRTLRQASKVNLVSEGFLPYFRAKYPAKAFLFISNGIDDGFELVRKRSRNDLTGPEIILYAGNIGAGQGLEKIVPELARELGSGYEIWIVGDGGRRAALEGAITHAGVQNVRLIEPVERTELISLYSRSDYLFLHLNDVPAFEKVLPSKIFEYAATGKPILAGVSGYAAKFLRSKVENASIFSPGNVAEALTAFRQLSPQMVARSEFVSRFDRKKLSLELACEVQSLVESRSG